MAGNTGTYLDSPFHRYAGGLDLAALPLESCAEVPAVLARTAGSGSRAVDVGTLAALEVAGRAVLLHTGGDAAWGRSGYATDAPSGAWARSALLPGEGIISSPPGGRSNSGLAWEGTLARISGKWQREIRTRITQSEAQNSGFGAGREAQPDLP